MIAAKTGACLHLKTGATFAGHSVLLYDPNAIDPSQFDDVEPLRSTNPPPPIACAPATG